MDTNEWLSSFRPFELFSECFLVELEYDSLLFSDWSSFSDDDWDLSEMHFDNLSFRFTLFFNEISARGLKGRYLAFKDFVRENEIL